MNRPTPTLPPRRSPDDTALPVPDAVALEHARHVEAVVRARLADGPLGFAGYMNVALYEPGLGYYMAGASKFGGSGDFVTAPELGPLFGQAVAAQCREVLGVLAEAGEPPAILELGAGTGALAASVLDALADIEGLRYLVLEPSAELAHRQRERLSGASGRATVEWLDRLPVDFAGVVLANEVVDALPVERFVKTGSAPGECVRVEVVARDSEAMDQAMDQATDEDSDPVRDPARAAGRIPAPSPVERSPFEDAFGTAPPELIEALARVERDLPAPLPAGYASELNLNAAPWLRALSDAVRRGVILLIDYGYPRHEYYLPERTRGTLACHYRHRMHPDPYLYPGLQDITAHVDFTALVEAGTGEGLELLGYTSQSAFLLGCDLLGLAEARLATLDGEVDRLRLSQGVKTLTMPGEMGERFQVVAFGRDYDPPLRGFAVLDLAHRL